MQTKRNSLIYMVSACILITIVILVALVLTERGGHQRISSNTDSSDPRKEAADGNRPLNAGASGRLGAIEGTVLFGGKSLDWPPEGGLLSNVVVYLKGASLDRSDIEVNPDDHPASGHPAILDQVDMTFVPHVVTMQKGGTLEIRNSDSMLHNVNGLATANQPFNVALSPQSTSRIVLPRQEFIRVACNFHPRMSAWVAVLPNRFFTKVDELGRFRLSDVPPGSYTLAGWYESVFPPYTPHRVSIEATIRPGETTVLELNFP